MNERKEVCSTGNNKKAMLRFYCRDYETIVDVDPRCCYESKYARLILKTTIKDEKSQALRIQHGVEEGDIGRFPRNTSLSSGILKLATGFCISRLEIFEAYAHDDNLLSQKLEDFDQKFLQKRPIKLVMDLSEAAFCLGIQSLMDLTDDHLADLIKGMSIKGVLETLGLPDITHKAWKDLVYWDKRQPNYDH